MWRDVTVLELGKGLLYPGNIDENSSNYADVSKNIFKYLFFYFNLLQLIFGLKFDYFWILPTDSKIFKS